MCSDQRAAFRPLTCANASLKYALNALTHSEMEGPSLLFWNTKPSTGGYRSRVPRRFRSCATCTSFTSRAKFTDGKSRAFDITKEQAVTHGAGIGLSVLETTVHALLPP